MDKILKQGDELAAYDPGKGVWAKHIIPIAAYKKIIESKGYRFTVLPASRIPIIKAA